MLESINNVCGYEKNATLTDTFFPEILSEYSGFLGPKFTKTKQFKPIVEFYISFIQKSQDYNNQ
jgi:hypothetical protein